MTMCLKKLRDDLGQTWPRATCIKEMKACASNHQKSMAMKTMRTAKGAPGWILEALAWKVGLEGDDPFVEVPGMGATTTEVVDTEVVTEVDTFFVVDVVSLVIGTT